MSDDKQEMVTISYEVTVEKAKAMVSRGSCWNTNAQAAARKALDARKSKYERWRERMADMWDRKPQYNSMEDFLRDNQSHGWENDIAQLMAAAPELLEALIEEMCGRGIDTETMAAIRKALPEDVADEVLS